MKSSAPSQPPLVELEPPVRLFAGGGSDFERRLIESARADSIPGASLEHLARALNVPSASLPAEPLAEVLRASQLARVGSFIGVGGLGLVAALVILRAPAPVASVEARPPAATSSSQPAAAVPLVTGSTPPLSEPSAPIAVPLATPKSHTSVRSRALPARAEATRAPPEPIPVAEASGLRAELLALEAVQSALRAGKAPEAARALTDYERRFPHAELALEAELLGIDVLLARGERERARAQAQALLARPEAARYRERLEALSEGTRD